MKIKSEKIVKAPLWSRLTALVLITVQTAVLAPAQTLEGHREAGKIRLEQSLDRAKKERDLENWEKLSGIALADALSEWESRTIYIKELDRETWEEERRSVEAEYKLITEKNYVEWLCNNFFEDSENVNSDVFNRSKFRSEFSAALRSAAENWMYETEDGERTRLVSVEDAQKALAQWREGASNKILEEYLQKWENENAARYAGLAEKLKEKGIDSGEFNELISGSFINYNSYIKEEYKRIAAVEENALMNVLLYDKESLQRKSEAEAAQIIAQLIAQETKEETDKNADNLFKQLETMIRLEGGDDVNLEAVDEWLAQFNVLFERGLSQWEDAESKFLVQRAEWEKSAVETYISSEQCWADAYAKLREERKNWENKLQARLDEGIARWKTENSKLEQMLKDAQAEFANAVNEERSQLEQNIDTQIALYEQSRDMLALCFEGLTYDWREWGEKYNGRYSYWKTEDPPEDGEEIPVTLAEAEKIKAKINQYYIEYNTIDKTNQDEKQSFINKYGFLDKPDALIKIENWLSMIEKYKALSDGAIAELYKLSGGIFDSEGVWEYYDELEIELMKNRAVKEYWQKELDAAQAISSYAENNTSGKDTEAETLSLLKAAQDSYSTALASYEQSVAELEEKYGNVQNAKLQLEEVRNTLSEKKKEVESKRKDYSNALLALKGDSDMVRAIKNNIISLLVSLNNFDTGAAHSEAEKSAIEAYYLKAFKYAEAAQEIRTNDIIAKLINGDGQDISIKEKRRFIETAGNIILDFNGALNNNESGDAAAAIDAFLYNLKLKIEEEGFIPTEYLGVKLLIKEAISRYGETENAAEKNNIEKIIRESFEIIAQYWEDSITKTTAAVRFLTCGETGLNTGNMSKEQEEEQRLRLWLELQLELTQDQLRLETNADEKSNLELVITKIQWVLDGCPEEDGLDQDGNSVMAPAYSSLKEALNNNRADDALSKLMKKESFYTEFSQWSEYRYEYLLSKAGLQKSEWDNSIKELYGEYQYAYINKANAEARNSVVSNIKTSAELSRLLDNAAAGAGVRDNNLYALYDYICLLNDSGSGLNDAGKEIMEQYTAMLLEYAGVCIAEYGSAALIEQFVNIASTVRNPALENAVSKLNELMLWPYYINNCAGLISVMSGDLFKGAGGLLKDDAEELLVWRLIGELSAEELSRSAPAADTDTADTDTADTDTGLTPVEYLREVINKKSKEENYGWLSGFFNIDKSIQDSVLAKIAAIFYVGQPAEPSEGTDAETKENAADNEIYYRRQQVLDEYLKMLDGDIDEWLDNYTAAALDAEDKKAIKAAIADGSGIIETEFNREALRELLKPTGDSAGENGYVLLNRQWIAQSALTEKIMRLVNEQAKNVQYEQVIAALAAKVKEENETSSVKWHNALKELHLEDLEGLSDPQTVAILNEVKNNSGLDYVKNIIASKLDMLKFFFSNDEQGFSFALLKEEELEDIFNSNEDYTRQSTLDINALGKDLLIAENTYTNLLSVRDPLVQQIYDYAETLSVLENSLDKQEQFNSAKNALDIAESDYNNSWGSYDAVLNELNKRCEEYNNQIEDVNNKFNQANVQKQELRKNQGIYEWAQSVYLADLGSNTDENYLTPKERETQAAYSYKRAEAAVSVLEELIDERNGGALTNYGSTDKGYLDALADYKTACKNYYIGRVIAFETMRETAIMEDTVRKAEAKEQEALLKLIGEKYKKGLRIDENADAGEKRKEQSNLNALELIHLEKTAVGYKVSLAYTAENIAWENHNREDDTLNSYFTNEESDFPLVDNPDNKITYAKAEATEWLKKINSQYDKSYLLDLGLASLYLKYLGNNNNKNWITENPVTSHNGLGDLPMDKLHDFDVGRVYENSRLEVLQEAYAKIMSNESDKENLARYILYRDTMLNMDLQSLEQDELKIRAINKTTAEFKKTIDENINISAALFVSAAELIAAGVALMAGLFSIPAGIALCAAGAALAITATVYAVTASDLTDVKNIINAQASGIRNNVNDIQQKNNMYYAEWVKAKEDLSKKRETLDLYYGKKEAGQHLTYEDFTRSLGAILSGAEVKIDDSTSGFCNYYTKEVFNKSGGANAGSTINVIQNINSYLKKDEDRTYSVLNTEHIDILKNEQAKSIEQFNTLLTGSLEMKDEDKLSLKELALKAADLSLSLEERHKARAKYDELADKYVNTAGISTLKNNMKTLAARAFGSGLWSQKDFDGVTLNNNGGNINSYIKYERASEDYTGQTLSLLKENMLAAFDNLALAKLSLKEQEWHIAVEDFNKQKSEWTSLIETVWGKSYDEWVKAEEKINSDYFTWKENFTENYTKQSAAWEENYNEFLSSKDNWMTEQYMYAVNFSNYGILESSGLDAARIVNSSLEAALKSACSSMEEYLFNNSGYTEQLLEGTNLAMLMNAASGINELVFGNTALLRRGITITTDSNQSLYQATKLLSDISEERRKAACGIAAQQAKKYIAAAVSNYVDRLAAENKAMKDWETDMAREAGYDAHGNVIDREMVVGATFVGSIKEIQTLYVYNDFITEIYDYGSIINDENLEGLDDYGIMIMVSTAEENLQKWGERIFGRTEIENNNEKTKQYFIPRTLGDAESGIYEEEEKKNESDLKEYLELQQKENLNDAEKAKLSTLNDKYVQLRDGELGKHIGYAPVFKDFGDLDFEKSGSDNIKTNGLGEMGKIMFDYLWNSLKAKNGFMELSQAPYERRLWDDRGSSFKAPNFRTVTDIAVSILATLTGPYAPLVNMCDDLLFASLDLNMSYKTIDEIGVELGKKAIVSTVSFGASYLGSAFGTVIEKAGIGSFAAGAVSHVAANASAVTANSAINSITYSSENGFGFNADGFTNSFKTGLVTTLTSSITSEVLAGTNLGNNLSKVTGFNSGQILDIKNLNNFLGSLAGAGATYAMTGNATFNLMNINGTGLLEMNLGKDGFGMTIGSGGVDISYGTIKSAIGGIINWNKNIQIGNSLKKTGFEGLATSLREQYGFGDEASLAQLESVLRGNTVFKKGDGSTAQTVTENGQRVVYVNNYNPNMTLEEQFMMGIVLGHEAHRDSIVDANNYKETIEAVKAHTEMAMRIASDSLYSKLMANLIGGSENLLNDIFYYDLYKQTGDESIFNSYANSNYDSSADFWKLISWRDGAHKLEWDGNKDLTIVWVDKGENGEDVEITKKITLDKASSRGQALVQILGEERALELLKKSNSGTLDNLANLSQEQIGELLMEAQGMSFNGLKWSGTSTFTLTDVKNLMGFIQVNKNKDGILDKFVVTSEAWRDIRSWNSKMGTGVAPIEENNKALDKMIFRKYDLNNQLIDTHTVNNVQTVDVYNKYDEVNKVDRRQPVKNYPQFKDKLEGNTVVSDFSLKLVADPSKNTNWAMNILNAKTLDGDWINKNSTDGQTGGVWGAHAGTIFLTSDGCFIITNEEYKKLLSILNSWGVKNGDVIKGNLTGSKLPGSYDL